MTETALTTFASPPSIDPLNRIEHGDCLEILRNISCESAGIAFDLAYLDPPFNTGETQRAAAGEFPDRWPTTADYLDFIRPRICEVIRHLKPHGSILLHCDWRTVHHLRLMLDELLGPERFINHLIWQYGLGGSSPRRFARKHDDILFYARSDQYYFNPPKVPATSRRMKGRMKKATDVLDIPAINNMSSERTGYPTQKPLALLELLIHACSPEHGIILDPFCGSGTTLLAAQRTRRRFLGIDRNPGAVQIARSRLVAFDQPMAPQR